VKPVTLNLVRSSLGRRRGLAGLGWALWLFLVPAAPAGAEAGLFAPRPEAALQAPEPGAATAAGAGTRRPTTKPSKPGGGRPKAGPPLEKQEPPYWQAPEDGGAAAPPYWQAPEEARARPYWEPEPERVAPAVPAAAAPEPAGPPLTYMFKDKSGVPNFTDHPVDPRYRVFTFTVRLQRGLAGAAWAGPLRFTHENLRPIILRAARTYGLDPALIAAVIKSESAFDAHAVSWAGAKGLMQLMPGTARDMDCADPFDPAQNIMAGSRYLRLMLDTFGGDLTLAVAAYNCGPEPVSRLGRVPDIPETKNYVIIVSRNYERYKGRF